MKIHVVFFLNVVITSSLLLAMEQCSPLFLTSTARTSPLKVSRKEIQKCHALGLVAPSVQTLEISPRVFKAFTTLRTYLCSPQSKLVEKLKEFDAAGLLYLHKQATLLGAIDVRKHIFEQMRVFLTLPDSHKDLLTKKIELFSIACDVITYADWVNIPLDTTALGIIEDEFIAQLSKSDRYLLIYTPRKLCIWDLLQCKICTSMAFSYDIQKVFFNNKETCFGVVTKNQLHFYPVQGGKRLDCLKPADTIVDVHCTPNDNLIAIKSTRSLALWDIHAKKIIFEQRNIATLQQYFFVSLDTLAMVYKNKIIIQSIGCSETKCIISCESIIHARCAPNGKFLAIAHENGSLSIWDITTSKCFWHKKATALAFDGLVDHFAFNHSSTLLAVAYHNGRIAFLNYRKCEAVGGVNFLKMPITSMQFGLDNNLYFATDRARRLSLKGNRCKVVVEGFDSMLGDFNQAATMIISKFENQLYINLDYAKSVGRGLAAKPFILGYSALITYLEFDHVVLVQEYYDIIPEFVKNCIGSNYTIIDPH